MEQRFDIYITGNFSEGTDPQAAIAAFAKAAGLDTDKAQQLFDQAPSAIKRNVDEATATSYQRKLASIGIETELRAVADSTEAPALTATDESDATESGEHKQIEPATAALDDNTGQRRLINFVFSGEGYEYFKIWIVNILLTAVTMGIYAPWAKVRDTQYFYGNTTLDGASFAFTADPVKMLIGRLIALGLFIVYMVMSVMLPLVTSILSIGFIFILPWVMVKSMAFYARNTSYRNIRFRFTGDYWGAFKVAILWPLAGMLTLTLLLPLAVKKQQEYMINNHSYGNKSFAFATDTWNYYRIFLIFIGIVFVGGIFTGVFAGIAPAIAPIGLFVAYVGAIVYMMVQMQNLVMNNSSLAEHNFVSDYQFKSFGLLMLGNFLLTIVTLGFYIPWAKVKLAHYAANHTQLDAMGDLDKFAAISQPDPSAFGEEFGDVFDMEVGF
ncbi:YjgN family protein [Simiduia agarivorans]|uniref:Thymidylate kinase n=1 Tax=Simiduia agarivorans (strain DSM 21679 / JCM 13881 / BCRC 17597 / SA1) TaxID=1117647 RepID=K4KLG2_SIMAS|nr:YjgN family protein [Simiduia agarivorans]AFU99060.1 thymidylate kinase [Simiduia agarivorans SA1 = DSM 21679]